MRLRCRVLLPAAALCQATVALADPLPPAFQTPEGSPPAEPVEAMTAAPPLQVEVHQDRPGGDASSRVTLGRRELELRPRLRPGDILEAVPGLFAVQHAGGGKANQYFLRGFDADHGTDVAFFVDGVPVNMPSHAHGQGFADFHFLIPELVVGLDGYKGPYYAELGDFATAGAVNLHLAEKLEESYAQASIGQYGVRRGLLIASPDLGDDWRTVLAAETYADDGPFVNPEKLRRFNIFARATHDIGATGKVSMTWMSYGSSWRGSGQIPARAVCGDGEAGNAPPASFGQPCIDQFGYVDPSEGGSTQRHMLSVAYNAASDHGDIAALAYLIRYRFALYSNFTFFDQDPVHGDEIEQDDERTVVGGDFRVRQHWHWGDAKLTSSAGVQARSDSVDNALWHDQLRVRLDPRVDAHVAESSVSAYLEEDLRVSRFLRIVAGLRGQRLDVGVDDHIGAGSGSRGAQLLLPKLSVIGSPVAQLDLFANAGRGFHSNDGRGVVLGSNGATMMTPATGYEVGARVRPWKDLSLSAAVFRLDLDSELVWSGDEGTTSPVGPTRRQGVELDARWHLSNWVFADVDATFASARYRENAGNGEAVALAPTRTLSAGVAARPTFGAWTPFAAVRVKSIGDRPAIEDESLIAKGFTVVDANAGLRWKDIEAAIDVQNLLGARWREVQFASDTRLPFEPATVRGITYSPGWPRTVIARATLYWR